MNKKDVKTEDEPVGIPCADQLGGEDHKLFYNLIQDSALAVVFLSSGGVVSYANHSFAKMVGYPHSEIKEKDIFQFANYRYAGDNNKRIFVDIIKNQRGEKGFEIQFRKKSGELCWVAVESLTYHKQSNNGVIIQCILKNVTKEKIQEIEKERLLETTKEQISIFQNLAENIEAHIVIRKIDKTIAWANSRFLDLYDSSLKGIVDKIELSPWTAEDTIKLDEARNAVIQNKTRKTVELFIEHKGTKYTILMTLFPILNEFGIVEYIGEIKNYHLSQASNQEQKWVCAGPLCTRRMLPVFFENAQNPIYATDGAGRLIDANQAFVNIYGTSKEHLQNKNKEEVNELFGIKGGEIILKADRYILLSGQNIEFECDIFHPVLNTMVHYHFNKFPLHSFDGKIYGVGTIMTDRTQLIEYKTELENALHIADLYKQTAEYQEYLLQSYIDNIPHYISIVNLEGRVELINQYASELWGNAKENIVNRHYNEYITDETFLQQISRDFRFVSDNKTPFETVEVLSRSDNEDIVFLSTVFPLFNESGVLFAIGVFRKDITDYAHEQEERMLLQEDLKKQHALLSAIIDSAPDFISIKNKEHRYIMVNQAFANKMHLTKFDFIGKDDLELGFPEELVKGNPERGIAGFWTDNQNVMNGGQVVVIPNEPSFIDGAEHTFVATKTPLKNAVGEVWGVLTFSHDITNELRQQEALRQATERFRVLYNSTPAMLYSINAEGEITTVSDYWLTEMGYIREEVIGQKLSRFVTPKSLQYSREVVWPLFLANGSCLNEEFQFIKKDGTIITCLLSAIAERNTDGLFIGSLEVLVNITELKRKEVEIADSKRLLNDFIDNIPYYAMILDLEQRYVMINDNAAKLYGATKEELIGLNYADILTYPENRKQLNENYSYVLKHINKISSTWKLRLSDYDIIDIQVEAFPIFSSTNEFTHVGAIVIDITDRVRREEELILAQQASETSQQLLKSFMDNATSAMFAKDENGTYILTNKKKVEYEQMREFSRFDPNLKPLQFYNSELSRIDDARVIAQNKAMTFYDRLLTDDGSVIYTETVKFPIYDKSNCLIGVGGITTDITDSVIRENELEEAKKKAEDAASAQERFLASMSHDMRTPLNGVVGMINLLEQTPLSAEQKEYMEAMKVSSYNLRVLINDILDVSKIQAGKLNIEYVLFDLNEILVSVNNVFSHEAKTKGVHFSIELPSDTPIMLEGDPSRLSQILNNLIGNALKFTAEGFVKLKLHHENLADDKVKITFVIEDSGIGISEEGVSKLFQPFVQAGSDITRKFGGSGLGLSICKSMVELQQGEIGVNSTPGKGSVFHFSIPYTKAKQEKIEKTISKNSASKFIPTQPLSPMRCLVFEDNPINQKVAFHALKKVGITADIANNGKIGVEILKNDYALYDFVLMDIQMPEMDGYEATTVIRNELGLQVPIIAMTASALKGEKEHCIEVGMNDFVPKPFVIDELLYVIRKVIKKDREEEELIAHPAGNVRNENIKVDTIKQQAGLGDVPLYDVTTVLDMEDDNFTLEILNTFLDTIPKALEELNAGINHATDLDTVAKVAHKLNRGVGVLQMNEMQKQLATIEINAKNRKNLDQLPEALDVCCRIYNEVKEEITKLRDDTMTKLHGV